MTLHGLVARLRTRLDDLPRADDDDDARADVDALAQAVGRLTRIDVGAWCGRDIDELRRESPDACLGWRAGTYVPTDGEPWDRFSDRVSEAMLKSAEGVDAVLAITHRGVIRALVAGLLGIGRSMLAPVQPASMTVIGIGSRSRTYNLRPV